MNSNPENNLVATLDPSCTEGGRKKKIILFAADFEVGRLLMQEIKKGGHLVVETVEDADQLIHQIARTTPHLLVAAASPDSAAGQTICQQVHSLFPDLCVCFINPDLLQNRPVWQQTFQEVLAKPIAPETPRSYAEDSRIVLHDESLHAFWKGKLNRPKQEKGWEKICSHQEARFVLQLQTARKNHSAAKAYFECLSRQQSGLDQELAYRLAHGSYKALSWSRDLACKWLALLAHYVADAELEHLPKAGTPGPTIDFVHHDTAIEGLYATTLIILYQVKPAISAAFKEMVIARFDGQNEDALLALSLRLYGIAKFLQQVGTAQIELMDAWLDPSIVDRAAATDAPRGEHRNAGIYRDFYDLTFIVHSPEPLTSILKGFHAGTTYVQQERFLPSFEEFRRLTRDARNLGRTFPNNL